MNHLIQQRQLQEQIICDSAGTGGYHIGSPPDRRMAVAAAKRGIVLRGSARQFSWNDFAAFDLILAMDKSNYQNILSLDRQGHYGNKVKLMCEFCQTHSDREVPDPYYGGEAGFDYVINLLMDACEGLLAYTLQEIKSR